MTHMHRGQKMHVRTMHIAFGLLVSSRLVTFGHVYSTPLPSKVPAAGCRTRQRNQLRSSHLETRPVGHLTRSLSFSSRLSIRCTRSKYSHVFAESGFDGLKWRFSAKSATSSTNCRIPPGARTKLECRKEVATTQRSPKELPRRTFVEESWLTLRVKNHARVISHGCRSMTSALETSEENNTINSFTIGCFLSRDTDDTQWTLSI